MLCRETDKETGLNELLLLAVMLRCCAGKQTKYWIENNTLHLVVLLRC